MSIIELSQDLNEMQEYEPLPAGPYIAQVRDVEIRHSEKLPNGFFYVQLLIPVENFPADYDAANAPEGLTVIYARVQVPTPENRRSVRPFKNFIRALGLEDSGNKIDTSEWVNKELQVLLSTSEYQGAPVNNVESVSPVARV